MMVMKWFVIQGLLPKLLMILIPASSWHEIYLNHFYENVLLSLFLFADSKTSSKVSFDSFIEFEHKVYYLKDFENNIKCIQKSFNNYVQRIWLFRISFCRIHSKILFEKNTFAGFVSIHYQYKACCNTWFTTKS